MPNFDELMTTVQSAAPIVSRAIISGQIFFPQCELTSPHPDILCEYDVQVPVTDGFTLTANIFRSKGAQERGVQLPVVMCAHPYDNHKIPALSQSLFGGGGGGGAPQQYRLVHQTEGKPRFSTLTSWESPDPNFWIPAGYALVNLNLPGYANSEGPPTCFSEAQAKAYYDAIEWIAAQPWSNGNVGLNGVSFLAITQYHVAACQAYRGKPPPSLKCISPWEGLADPYREMWMSGGVEEIGFPHFWWYTEVLPALNGTVQDIVNAEGCTPLRAAKDHPLYDDWWQSKAAKLDQITLPMLVCASFSDHGLHTIGSLQAFERAKSTKKWLYTHRTGKWVAYYSDQVQQLTKDFMDCFLKGDTSSGFLDRPAVLRLEVRRSGNEIHSVRQEPEWPIPRTRYQKLYLADRDMLTAEPPGHAAERVYSARHGTACFSYTFLKDTELTGYFMVRLWVEVRSAASNKHEEESGTTSSTTTTTTTAADDMIVFVAVNKRDEHGQLVLFHGSVGSSVDRVSRGCLRVSRRKLDTRLSKPWQPVLSGDCEEKLKPGEIVLADVALCPSATFFRAGERLEVALSSSEIIPSPPYRKLIDDCNNNRYGAQHVFHFGGKYDSFLQVPEVESERVENEVTPRGKLANQKYAK